MPGRTSEIGSGPSWHLFPGARSSCRRGRRCPPAPRRAQPAPASKRTQRRQTPRRPLRAGSAGKSTTAWYVRGIFEDWALPGSEPPRVCVVGMAGSLENAVDVARLDRQGNLWQPEEEDPTLDRCAGSALCPATQ